jgi:hypothetical protein
LVLIAYTVSLFLRGAILIFNLSKTDEYFECTDCEGVTILTSDYFLGQLVLVVVEINQLIPHLVIPIALFVIPVKKRRSTNDVFLQEMLFDEGEEDEFNNTAIDRRIASSILSRSTSSIKDKQE